MNKETPTAIAIQASRKLIQRREYAEACEQLQKLLEDNPKDEDALELLGMASFFQHKLEQARDCFERLTQLNPSHIKAWVNLGAILNRMGNHRKATEALRRGLQRDRKCAEAHYNMGIAQRAMQMNTMSISAYKEALKLAPDMVDAHINLGNIYLEMKNIGLALQCFQNALRYAPESAKARRGLEKAQSTQKTAKKDVSPFGRLVPVADLSRQQDMTSSRELSASARVAERETVQKHTKIVRACAKEMITQLETTLPQQLHRVKISILQIDQRMDTTEILHELQTSIQELRRRQEILSSTSALLQECMQTS